MNNETFTPTTESIEKLFDGWYSVPPYQRPYRWKDEEIIQLWDDLWGAYERQQGGSVENYFLGAVIVSKPEKEDGAKQENEKDEFSYLDVIDGQQRLTSLTILFAVIRDNYPQINQKFRSNTVIRVKHLHRAIDNEEFENPIPRFIVNTKFIPEKGAATMFASLVTDREATCETTEKRPTKGELNDDNPKHNYIRAIQLFKERLAGKSDTNPDLPKMSIEKISDFITFIFKNVKVIKIQCASVAFAMDLFQIINTRGMNLRPSDLIKSYLLIKISEQKKQVAVNSERFIVAWRQTDEAAQNADSNLDEILTLFSYYELTESPGKNFYLYKNLKEHFDAKKSPPIASLNVIKDLSVFVNNYKEHIIDSEELVIFSLFYIPWKNLWKSVLLSAWQEKYGKTDCLKLANILRKFYYLHWIAGNRMEKVKKDSIDAIKQIKEKTSISKIETKLNARLRELDVFKKAFENLHSNRVAEESWCKPLLLSIEYTLKDLNPGFIKSDNKVQLEHIYPQTSGTGWEHITPKVAETYLHSFGNLTLLSGQKNPVASNHAFDKKIEHYGGKKRNKKTVSGLQLAQEIVDDYNAGKTVWDESAMEERKKLLIDRIAELLGVKKEMGKFLKKNSSQ